MTETASMHQGDHPIVNREASAASRATGIELTG